VWELKWSDGVSRAPSVAYLGVGSNIQPEKNIPWSLEALAGMPGVTLTGISTFYRTAPLPDPSAVGTLLQGGDEPDPDFLNGVLEVRTFLSPEHLLMALAGIESSLGRKPNRSRYAPRTIDLDLLLYGHPTEGGPPMEWEEVAADGAKSHSDILRRGFVALPLLELAPDLILPPHNIPLQALAGTFDTPGGHPEEEFTRELRALATPAPGNT